MQTTTAPLGEIRLMPQVVYVPVTDDTLSILLEADSTFGEALETLCLDELLGLFALQRLPEFLAKPLPLVEFEKLLALSFECGFRSHPARAPRNSLIINAEVILHNRFPQTRPEKRFSPLISRHRTKVTGLQ